MPTGIYIRTKKRGGWVVWNKGKTGIYSKETLEKMSKASKGRPAWNKGKKLPPFSKEQRINMSEGCKRNGVGKWMKGRKLSETTKRKISQNSACIWKGKKHSGELKKKMGMNRRGKCKGKNNPSWKGGITPINMKIRKSIEYRFWLEGNFARDNYTCQKCKVRGGKLRCHHIQNFAQCPELRVAINNGITFCEGCHREFHKIYGIKNNTKEQIIDFLNGRISNKMGNLRPTFGECQKDK